MQLELPRITKLGAALVAISPQTPEASLITAEKNALTFEILSDRGNGVAGQFGIAFQLPEALREVYRGIGHRIPELNGDETWELPIPATYVIDKDRTIRMAYVEPNHMKRVDPEDIIEALSKCKSG